MPVFTPEYLEKAAYHIYVAKGTPPEEAEIVAAHQVKANLVGHDSHGVIHIPEYCERVDRGHIVPRRAIRGAQRDAHHRRGRRPLGIRLCGHGKGDPHGHR